MPRKVRLHRKFVDDVRRRVAWLAAHDRVEWSDGILVGVDEIAARLARFPEMGPVVLPPDRKARRAYRGRKVLPVA